jgi:hypothetical protein
MKKALLLFAVALFVVSCQGPVGPEGPQGYGTNWKIISLIANPNDWTEHVDQNSQNRYYSCHFSTPEINTMVFNDGSVSTYFLDNAVQQPLPYVRHYQDTNGAFWTKTIDYDFSIGSMNIYVTNSDFAVDPPTTTMNFRVVLMW